MLQGDNFSGILKPLHFNMLERYSFSMPDEVKMGNLRPLRDPENP